MKGFLFSLVVLIKILGTTSAPCSSCPFGCCDSWRRCATELSDCHYYLGEIATYAALNEPCILDNDCQSTCCRSGKCTISEECEKDSTNSHSDLVEMECHECPLGCCNNYRICASNLDECVYYSGPVTHYTNAMDVEHECIPLNCLSGCCIDGFCASDSSRCSWSTWQLIFMSLSVFAIAAFIFLVIWIRYKYSDRQKEYVLRVRKQALNREKLGMSDKNTRIAAQLINFKSNLELSTTASI